MRQKGLAFGLGEERQCGIAEVIDLAERNAIEIAQDRSTCCCELDCEGTCAEMRHPKSRTLLGIGTGFVEPRLLAQKLLAKHKAIIDKVDSTFTFRQHEQVFRPAQLLMHAAHSD